jgi:hypothetical protein
MNGDEREDGDEEDSDVMGIDGGDNDAADNDDDDGAAAVEVDVRDPLGRTQQLSPEEEFVELCTALQRNDPETTYVYYPHDVPGYGPRLGQALVGNTHIEELNLALIPNIVDNGTVHFESIRLILQYMREGTAFRALAIWGGIRDYTGPCLMAISQNPNAVKLTMTDDTEVPEDEVVNLLRTSQSIKEISMPMVNSIAIAEAFEANQTLTYVALKFDPDSWPPPNGVILRHLVAHRPPCSLTIGQESDSEAVAVDAALAAFLAGTTWLKELRMLSITFYPSRMRHFLEGLQSNRSIEKLRLVSCDFDQETVSVLRDVTEAPTNGLADSAIREILIEERDDHLEALSAELVALIVLGMPGLQVLDWRWSRGSTLTTNAFWNTLTPKASMVHLSVLKIEFWPAVNRHEMNDCLPLLPALQELHFRGRHQYESWEPHAFLDAVMQCPRLHDITLDNALPRFWSAEQARLARALFQRNQFLYQLVSMPRLDHMVQEDEDSAETCLYPSLFSAAKRSVVVAPNSILAGLLALSDTIGFA